ncbi:MAG: 4-(cytidine 5'-diphospho)-2-C-methyl-D-erythritol kinase, partial [Actinomycetota bacterium]
MPTLEARAKINLFLRVLGRRADGFHEIESIFHTVDLADRIEVDDADDLVVEMDEASEVRLDIPPEENIVYRAAQLLRRTSEVPHGARIRILKSIPFGAGLGGGSVDAAAVLVALERTWGLSLSDESLRDVAAEVGSDVPYCLTGGPALVTGR